MHRIEIASAPAAVWAELWALDLLDSPTVRLLLGLRGLPKRWLGERTPVPVPRHLPRRVTLHDLETAGFGRLAESDGGETGPREVVFGVEGRFWRPVGNLSPFRREAFDARPPAGTCHAYWNFLAREVAPGVCELYTETRIRAGDRSSRRRFRLYWFLVRPLSGLIRIRLLRAVRRACRARVSEH